jgi:hypothetical protein
MHPCVRRVGCSLVEHDLLAWAGAAPSRRLRMAELAGLLRVTHQQTFRRSRWTLRLSRDIRFP